MRVHSDGCTKSRNCPDVMLDIAVRSAVADELTVTVVPVLTALRGGVQAIICSSASNSTAARH